MFSVAEICKKRQVQTRTCRFLPDLSGVRVFGASIPCNQYQFPAQGIDCTISQASAPDPFSKNSVAIQGISKSKLTTDRFS